MPGGVVYLDDFTFDPSSGRLWRGADEITLRPKSAAVLSCLASHRGAVVSRNHLLGEIWTEGFVTDAVLSVCINELRAALGDDRRNPRFIATVPRRGYQLLAAAAPRAQPEPELRVDDGRPFVGRDAEIEHLAQTWRDAMDGRRQMVFIAAQAGVGKTALVDRFTGRLAIEDQALIARGQCVEQFGVSEPYLPMLDALTDLCRSQGDHFVEVLASAAPTWLMQIPSVAGPARLPHLRATTAGASSERMLREFAIALEMATEQWPVVIVCEDLQAGDWSTTELLRYMALRRDPARLLIIGTYRPADLVARDHPLRRVVADLRVHTQCQLLPLELLSRDAVHSYLVERLHPRRPSEALVDDLYARTEGNALFTAEVVDFLTGDDHLVDIGGEVHSRQPLASVGVPDSITQFIEQQIDALDAVDREVLEAASAVGDEFATHAVVAALGDRRETDADDVDERCSRLVRRSGLLIDGGLCEWTDGTLTALYRFRHALFRDALYHRITPTRRVAIHRLLGARLASAWSARADEFAGELAMHFEEGGELARAAEFLALAAETAQRRVAPRETLGHANRGLELLDRIAPMPGRAELELRLRIQQVVAMTALHGLYGDAVEHAYQQARRVSADVHNPSLVGPVIYGLWKIAASSSRTADMGAMTDELGQLANRLGDRVLAMRADLMSGLVDTVRGRPADGLARTRRCLERYDPDADRLQALVYGDDAAVDAHRLAAIASWYLGYPDQAREHAAESCRRADELQYPHDVFRATTGAMYVDVLCRDVRRVRERVADLLAACDRIGMGETPHQATVVDAWAVAVGGGSPSSPALTPTDADLSIVTRNTFLSSLVAETAAARGDIAGALRIASGALEVARASGHVQYEPELLRLVGELTLRSGGASDESERAFLEAIEIARSREARSHELRAATSLARLWSTRGERDRARDLLAPIHGWFTEGHDTGSLREAAALLAELDGASERTSSKT